MGINRGAQFPPCVIRLFAVLRVLAAVCVVMGWNSLPAQRSIIVPGSFSPITPSSPNLVPTAPKSATKSLVPADYLEKGNRAAIAGDADGAIAAYSEAIRLNGRFLQAYIRRGFIYGSKGNVDLAFQDFNKALLINPNAAEAYFLRGLMYQRRQDFELAIADFTRASQLRPTDARPLVCRGQTRAKTGQLDLGVLDIQNAIRLDPKSAEAHLCMGNMQMEKKAPDLALAEFSEAIRLKPGFAPAYGARGWAHYITGDLEHSALDYRKGLELARATNDQATADTIQSDLKKISGN